MDFDMLFSDQVTHKKIIFYSLIAIYIIKITAQMQNLKQYNSQVQFSNIHSSNFSNQNIPNEDSNCITLPKVKCAFHPNQTITNFCTCESCLLPLCPSCIKIHTIEHINMKKINPQYEPITDLLEQIYADVQQLLNSNNEGYQKILEIDARVGSFRLAIQQKVASVKQSVLNEVEKYFAKLDEDVQMRIDNMNYIQMLKEYKQQSKKTIIGLKNIQKCFNPQNDKIMRIVIKFKGQDIKKQVQKFQHGLSDFLRQVNNNFMTFSVREDYRQAIHSYLDTIKRIQVSDVKTLEVIPNISNKLHEVYEKTSNQHKKQIRKSIGSFLANSAAKRPNQENQIKQSYASINNSHSKPIITQSYNSTPSKEINRRNSSKGKGLSLMQINNTVMTSGNFKAPRAVNICSPIQFNRTTIIRRQK